MRLFSVLPAKSRNAVFVEVSVARLRRRNENNLMSVQVYGCNHIAIEVDDVDKATAFYQDVFNLEKLDQGEGDAFFKTRRAPVLGDVQGERA